MNCSSLLILFAIVIIGGCGADNSSISAAAGVSKKRAVSNHLPLIRHETFANAISALHVSRRLAAGYQLFSKSSKKADEKSGKADSSSTKSDKANKSAKAYPKAQIRKMILLYSHHVLMFKQNDA